MDRGLRKLIALQLGLTLLAAGLCAIREIDWAVSALAGGGIGTTATGAAAVCITHIKGGSPGTLLGAQILAEVVKICLLYTSPSPRDRTRSRMPSSA